MKKICLVAFVAILSITSINAQEVKFGVTAGLFNASAKAEFEGISADGSEAGFYIGGVADISISEKLHIQPELVYVSVDGSNGIALPIIAKYYVSDDFNIQFGPHLDFTLEDVPTDFTGLGISLAAGLGYDINENIFIEGRYAFQLNDYYTGDLDINTTTNSLMIGVGYRFN